MRTLAEAVVTVDLAKIEENARRVVDALPGIDIVGVTKVTCGTPEVAAAMLAGGVSAIGESRLENIERMRDVGVAGPFWLIRAAPPLLAEETVRLAEVSLASEFEAVGALDRAAYSAGIRHGIVAMVDVGDLREGMMPEELPSFVRAVERLESIDLLGVGTSLTCYGAIVPSEENLGLLAGLAAAAEQQVGGCSSRPGHRPRSRLRRAAGLRPQSTTSASARRSFSASIPRRASAFSTCIPTRSPWLRP